jgi:hypothetical protein
MVKMWCSRKIEKVRNHEPVGQLQGGTNKPAGQLQGRTSEHAEQLQGETNGAAG